jgi:hypothetical protein
MDEWYLGERPELDVGGLNADSTDQFFYIRDARFLQEDRLVVANGGTQELRFFDARDGGRSS